MSRTLPIDASAQATATMPATTSIVRTDMDTSTFMGRGSPPGV